MVQAHLLSTCLYLLQVQGKVAVIRLQEQRVRDLNSIQSSNTNQLLGELHMHRLCLH